MTSKKRKLSAFQFSRHTRGILRRLAKRKKLNRRKIVEDAIAFYDLHGDRLDFGKPVIL